VVYVARTNVDIDDALIGEVMKRYDLATKRQAVDFALRRLLGTPMTTDDVLAMEGTGWPGDLESMRDDPPATL
jgi:Arc/MetJ family transcription regulator